MNGGWHAVSEMAQTFGLVRQTLVRYDRIGLFHSAVTTDAGCRCYAPTQM